MADFSMKANAAKGGIDELNKVSANLGDIYSQILDVRNNLGFEISSAGAIRSRLYNLAGDVDLHRKAAQSMSDGLNRAISNYERTEKRICAKGNVGNNLQDLLSSLFGFTEGQIADLRGKFGDIVDFFKKIQYNEKTWKDLLLLGITGLEGIQGWIDGTRQELVDATTWKGEVEASWAYWEAGVEGEYGSAGVSVMAASAYASAEAGLLTMDEDGNVILNPHVDAEMGASFTALHADAQAQVGDDMFGAGASASVDVGKVSAKADVSAGILDENGGLDPRLHASASAEAIAVEAKADAGVTVLGTEAKVEAGVNVGIGAHADVGYEDGVFSFDIGASLGIGASIALEVDVGGTIDAVKDGAKSFFKGLLGK